MRKNNKIFLIMIKNDKLIVPYYMSDNWKNILEARLQTLKEDSLYLKEYTFYKNAMNGIKRNLTMEFRSKYQKTKNSFYPSNSNECDYLYKDITEDSLKEINENNALTKHPHPVFKKREIGIPCLRMKSKWNLKSKNQNTINPGLTTLLFPDVNNKIIKAEKTSNANYKRKYLLFLKQQSMVKISPYY